MQNKLFKKKRSKRIRRALPVSLPWNLNLRENQQEQNNQLYQNNQWNNWLPYWQQLPNDVVRRIVYFIDDIDTRRAFGMLKYPRKLVIPQAIRDRIEQNISNTSILVVFIPDLELDHIHIYNSSYIYSRESESLHVLTKGCDEFDDYYFTHKIFHGIVFDRIQYTNTYFRNKTPYFHYETLYKYIESTKTTIYINKPMYNTTGVVIPNFHKISIASTDLDQRILE